MTGVQLQLLGEREEESGEEGKDEGMEER